MTGKKARTAITPTRKEDYPKWYQQVIRAADLADTSPVRGCMVIKPWGYAIWENMQKILNSMFRETGHKNAYFPLFIPKSFLEKEAEHVKGFAKECAVVTHHRLEERDGKLVPAGELEEPLIVRPTSETIIGASFSKWIRSYRDLPLLINQWCNVVRWEMRTRLFLRTTEFLWQEGHTAHVGPEEAWKETQTIHDIYARFAEEFMAMPVVKGEKTPGERFPGAEKSLTIEAMMQDRKALQAGTSHFLGQNFSRAQDINYLDESGKLQYAWTTSWGVTTRLIGGLVMTHSDDNGLILPPRLSPAHVVIIPILFKADDPDTVLKYCINLRDDLQSLNYDGRQIEVELDDQNLRGGDKVWKWIKKGVPIRLEIGPRDISSDSVSMARRDRSHREKQSVSRNELVSTLPNLLQEIQDELFERGRRFCSGHTHMINSKEEFLEFFGGKGSGSQISGGFALAHWCGDEEIAHEMQRRHGVTIRCVPLGEDSGDTEKPGKCIFTGRPSDHRVVWARAY